MKKLFLLLFVCCTAVACEQNDVVQPQSTTKQATKSKYRTLDEAIDIAEKSVSMLGEQTRATKRSVDRSRIRAVLDRRATTRSTAADTLIYIINFDDSAGFALVPRSTSKPELLAITEKGNYDGEETDNEGFNIYMDRAYFWIKDSTKLIPVDTSSNPGVGGGGIGDQVITEWKSETERSTYEISPMITTIWHQREPFNNYCFDNGASSGEEAPAGCTAIALAQLMAYHEHPQSTNLTFSFAPYSAIELNWSMWKNNVYIDAIGIAAFIREIGERVNMDYSPDGSGASFTNARNYLRNIGYSCGTHQDYSQIAVLNSLENNHPVMIEGYRRDTGKGHAWLIDGYKSITETTKEWHRELGQVHWTLVSTITINNKYLHFKWGAEGGSYDGHFFIEKQVVANPGGTNIIRANIFTATSPNIDYNNNVKIIPNIYH